MRALRCFVCCAGAAISLKICDFLVIFAIPCVLGALIVPKLVTDVCGVLIQVHAFHHKISAHYGARHGSAEHRKHVVSFGDSIHERHAIHRTSSRMKNVATKSVKFVERPNIEQLKRQVDLVTSCFKDIAHHPGDLDLMLTIQLLYNS